MLDETGRIGGYGSSLKKYDVLSAFSMSYRGESLSVKVPLSSPLGELPPIPIVRRRLTRRGPCSVYPWEPVTPTGDAPAEALSQQTERKNVEETDEPAEALSLQIERNSVAGADGPCYEGYLFLSGAKEMREK